MKIYSSLSITVENMFLNRALNYGDGVFETMLLHNDKLPLWVYHYKRLTKGLKLLGIQVPNEYLLLEKIQSLSALMSSAGLKTVKLMVFRSGIQRSYKPLSSDFEWTLVIDYLSTDTPAEQVFALANYKMARQTSLAGIKHLNRLEQVILASELNDKQVNDLIVLDIKNNVVETTCKNLLMIKNDKLYTPSLKHCGIEGVALNWLKERMQIEVKKIKLSKLDSFDAIIMCNSIRGFLLVSEVTELKSFASKHPIHDKITALWQTQVLE